MGHWIQYALLLIIVLLLVQKFIPVKGLTNLTGSEVKDLLRRSKDHTFIDVREIHEYQAGHIKGFKNISA